MARVRLESVNKSYGKQQVVKDFSLDVADGEFIVFLGPSGCGKSTVLRMIAGLEDISSGELYIGSNLMNRVEAKERNLAMVFQSYALYPHMTVYENVSFALRIAGLPKTQIDIKVRQVAEMLQLTDLLKRKPSQLSGGQRQRVAMGRAMVRNPELFLFDEPLSNLDSKLRAQMRDELKDIHHKLRTTTIYVTHDQIEAMTLADRIVVMREGRIEQVGTPTEVFLRPVNIFVAGFIGSPAMNFFDVSIAESNGSSCANAEGLSLPIPDSLKLSAGRQLTAGLRPSDISLGKGDGKGRTMFSGTVLGTEIHGAEVLIKARVGSSVYQFQSHLVQKPEIGETLVCSYDSEALMLFDRESGQALSHLN